MACNEEKAKEILEAKLKIGYCLDVILKDASEIVHLPSFIKLYEQLVAGLLFNNGTKLYKFDLKTKSHTYFIHARGLEIAWIDDCRYWKWITIDFKGKKVEAAELIRVCWLDIRVKIKSFFFSPGTLYEIVIVAMKIWGESWHFPINLEIKGPKIHVQRKECLQGKPRDTWFEIVVGDVKFDHVICGGSDEIEVAAWDHGEYWKSGIIFVGVEIRPKLKCGC